MLIPMATTTSWKKLLLMLIYSTRSIIDLLNTKYSYEKDGISITLLKSINEICKAVTPIINESTMTGIVPNNKKNAKVINV